MRRKWYSLKSLVGMALLYQNREVDQNRYWSLINRLHALGTPEIILLGKRLYQSHNWHKRLLAVEIYNQLSSFDALGRYVPYAVEASQLILCQALYENRVEIIQSAICGLGHRPTALALPRLISFASHCDIAIRYQLAVTLGHYDDSLSIEALLKLARDDDGLVREWATFALGTQHEDIDNPEIRKVLWNNINDEDESVAGEALVGLAIRKDLRLVEVMKARLKVDCSRYVFTALEYMPDPLFYSTLQIIEQSAEDSILEKGIYWLTCLYESMEACKPRT